MTEPRSLSSWDVIVHQVREDYAHRLGRLAWEDMRPLQQAWVKFWVEQFSGERGDEIRGLR